MKTKKELYLVVLAASMVATPAAAKMVDGAGGADGPPQPTCSTHAGSFDRTKTYTRSFGDYNKLWASYTLSGSVVGKDKTVAGTTADMLEAKASLTADVRVFGLRQQIAKVAGRLYSIYGQSAGASLDVYAMGYNIYHTAASTDLNYNKTWDRTFFSASQWFTVGPVPVNVTETVNGSIGVDIAGGLTTTGVGLDIEPSARAWGTGSVAVEAVVAAFGLTGSVTFLEVGVPIEARASLSSNCMSYSLDVDTWLKSLNGHISAWVRVLFTKYSHKIITWDGYQQNWSVCDYAGGISLG